jgi:cytochrome c oxidase cbb3-type subunit III
MSEKYVDDVTGIETTGHEWDGIRELDNPLPNWWRWIWYATIIWSFGYWIVYPAWPLVSSYTKGVFGYSARAIVAEEMAAAKARQKVHLDKLEKTTLQDIRTDPELLNFAMAGGRSAFNVNCSQCHGSGAQGFSGYPNLNDDEWLWGGTLDAIHKTIAHGVRNPDSEDARDSAMPAFLKDETLDSKQVNDVAEYVLALSGEKNIADAAERGKPLFAEHCVACHGKTGDGNAEFGAPALNNKIWLYGGDKKTLVETISYSRGGVMPAWGEILDAAVVKQLTIYIHSLGGGQ